MRTTNHQTKAIFSRLVLIVALAGATLTACKPAVQTGEIALRVTEDVIYQDPPRLGINIGRSTYFGDRQVVAQPLAHGGFAKGRMVYFIQSAAVLDNTVEDTSVGRRAFENHPLSLAGGTYVIATGRMAGTKGTILAHEPGTCRFTLDLPGGTMDKGEYLWLSGPPVSHAYGNATSESSTVGIGDFRPVVQSPVTLTFVDSEWDPTDQYARFSFPNDVTEQRGGISHFFAAHMDSEYELRVRARSSAPGARLDAQIRLFGIEEQGTNSSVSFDCDNTELGPEWREYVFTYTTGKLYAILDRPSTITVTAYRPLGSSVQSVDIDYITLHDSRSRSASGFSKEIEEVLREANVGAIRFHGIMEAGTTVDSMTAPNAAQASWTFMPSRNGFHFMQTSAVLDECLRLSGSLDATAWFSVGGVNTPDDWYALVSYLSAPEDFDEYARRRAANGQSRPWTEQVSKVYLEIGNEWWNPLFRPYFIWEPEKYAELCKTIINRLNEHPHFDPEKIELIFGGWAANASRWTDIVWKDMGASGRISVAPYLLRKLDQYETIPVRYGALFGDVDDYLRNEGAMLQRSLRNASVAPKVSVYELNSHLTSGEAPPSVASEMCPSVAAGVAVLDQAMSLMELFQPKPVIYFTLLQRAYGGGQEQRLGLWGNLIRASDGTLQPRPIWQGLEMANRHLIQGPMVATVLRGSPTWNQPKNGSCEAMSNVPYLHSYAFLANNEAGDPKQMNVLLINRHTSDSLPVSVSLPFEPDAQAARITLTGQYPMSHNERGQTVAPVEDTISDFKQGAYIIVPPFSAVVYQFREKI